ncbi:H-NS family nucleoid-associated regulatory protein [Acinetobacter baumannii]
MNKQTSDSSNLLQAVFDTKESQKNSLEGIVANVSQLPTSVIDQMLAHAAKELEKRKLIEKDEALLKILEIVKRYNIPFDEITHILESADAVFGSHSENGKYRKLYIDPNNNMNTWTGVGRRPDWIREKVEKGENIEKFAVQVNDADNQRKLYFFNPKKPTQRWNGLGRKPFWFKALEETGEDLEKYKTYI